MSIAPKNQIDRLSVAEQVYLHLRTAILSGEIAQGARVVEAQVAKSMGTSRAPVREAVNRLLQDGLLESRTHFGPSVIQMTPEKIRGLYDVRVAIDGLAMQDVTRRRKEVDISVLRTILNEMRRTARNGDLISLVEAELRFHQAIRLLASNPYLKDIGEMIDGQVRMALVLDNSAYSNLMDVADEHEPLIDVIESGDCERAGTLIATHILSSLKF